MDRPFATVLVVVVPLLLTGCQQRGGEVIALRREVAALRSEVERLRARVDQLQGAGASVVDAGAAEGEVRKDQVGLVTFRFSASPVGARVSVDGEPVAGDAFQAPADGRMHKVRVERPGHRTIEQFVRADRDRTLRYLLRPGRGLQQLAPAR